ncbi:MAG: hypothetical protein HY910_01325 [Desulfarculus sp.]|nr:hypothetical protein [Desulfarculus sp.]
MKKLFAALVAMLFALTLALPGMAEAAPGDDLSQPAQTKSVKKAKKAKKAKKTKKTKKTKKVKKAKKAKKTTQY